MHEQLIEWLRSWGELSAVSGVALASVFVVASFVLIPRTFLYLGVGALYGLAAIPIVLPSTTLGGVLAFLAARYLLAERVQSRLDRHPGLRAIADAVDEESWRIVALLRFAAPIPNAVQNYVFGVTRIGVWPYTLATLLFTVPQTVLYVYLGAAGRAAVIADASSPLSRALMAAGALCMAVMVFVVWRKSRAALARLRCAHALRS